MMFGLVWIDNGWDCTMGLLRMVPEYEFDGYTYPAHGPVLFHVDDWYGMIKDMKGMGKVPSAPSNCPDNRYLLLNGKKGKL